MKLTLLSGDVVDVKVARVECVRIGDGGTEIYFKSRNDKIECVTVREAQEEIMKEWSGLFWTTMSDADYGIWKSRNYSKIE